jgi:hypothetical protein
MVMCSRQSSRCRAMRCYANPFPSFPSILAPSWLCFCVTRVGLLVVKRRLGQHRITTYEVIRIAEVKDKRITNRNVYSWGITVQVSSHIIIGGCVSGFHTAISASMLSSSAPPTLPSPSSLSSSPFFPPASSAQDSSIQPTMRSLARGNML